MLGEADYIFGSTSAYINFAGQRRTIHYNRADIDLSAIYAPKSLNDHCNTAWAYSADHPFAIEFFELEACERNLFERDRKARSNLRALLNSIPTLGALNEVWPEGKPYYADLAQRPPVMLPAVDISALNTMLGLPKPENENENVAAPAATE